MDDYIPRKVVLDELDNIGFFDDDPIQTRNAALRIVKRIPSADVAFVVRCRDCKWWVSEKAYCRVQDNFVMNDDGFCSVASQKQIERKD